MVQTYQEQTKSRAANGQDLNVNPTPSAFGAAYGEALKGLGNAFGNAATALDAKDALTAENEARDAQTRFMEVSRQLRYDPNTGYLNQTGTNASGGQARATFEDRLTAERDKIASGLSPRARKLYENSTREHVQSVKEVAIRHDATQLREVTVATGKATVDSYLNEAMLNYNNPEVFDANVQKALAETTRLNLYAGMPAEAAEAARNDLTSGAYLGAMARMANEGVGGATRAKAFYERNVDKLTAEDKAKFDTAMKPILLADTARLDANAATGTPRPRAGDVPTRDVDRGVDIAMAGPMANTNLSYSNQGATRNQRVSPGLETMLATGVEAVYGPGARVVVYSGGQPGKGESGKRTGSTRHDHGGAADVHIYGPDGKQVTGDALGAMAQYWLARGFGGAGLEMRGGGIHLDEHADRPPTWDYAAEGGQFTPAQQAAVQAGLQGQMPEGSSDRLVRAQLGRAFGGNVASAVMGASQSAPMESIIGVETAQKMGLVGKTAGQYIREVQMAYGTPDAPKASGDNPNFAAGYTQAAAIMATDPERGQAMYEEVRRRQTAYDAAQTAGRQDNFDNLWQRGVQTGDWNLTMDERMGLGAQMSAAFDNAAQGMMQGLQYTDPVVFTGLQDMAQKDPVAFSKLELADYLADNKLSDSDYRALFGVQLEMRKATDPAQMKLAVTKANKDIDPGKVWGDAKGYYQTVMGYDPDAKDATAEQRAQTARFRMALPRALAEAALAQNRPLTPMEQQTVINDMLAPVQTDAGGTFSSPTLVPKFDVDNQRKAGEVAKVSLPQIAFEQVPPTLAEALGSALPADLNPDQRRKEVARTFNDMVVVANGGVPEATIDDVPAEMKANHIDNDSWAATIGGLVTGLPIAGEDEYLITDANGATVRLTETELVQRYALSRRKQLVQFMDKTGVNAAMIKALVQPHAY